MLHREVELRRHPDTLAAMQRAEETVHSEWMDVVAQVQHQVVREFEETTSSSSPNVTVRDLRAAALRHPEIAFWVKHKRARRSDLSIGDTAPDVPLCRAINDELTTLLASGRGGAVDHKRTEVAAGSLS